MGSGAFYSVRGLLLKSLPVRAEVQAGSACRTLRAQRVLWEAMRLVWAVACVRTAPRRRRELHAGSTRGAEEGAGRIESAIMRRPVGGGGFYGKRCVL